MAALASDNTEAQLISSRTDNFLPERTNVLSSHVVAIGGRNSGETLIPQCSCIPGEFISHAGGKNQARGGVHRTIGCRNGVSLAGFTCVGGRI